MDYVNINYYLLRTTITYYYTNYAKYIIATCIIMENLSILCILSQNYRKKSGNVGYTIVSLNYKTNMFQDMANMFHYMTNIF